MGLTNLLIPTGSRKPTRRKSALFGGRGRSSLAWCLGFLAISQLFLIVVMERWKPILRDPEYGIKLMRLQSLQRKDPERPLFLVIGSSRTGLGLRTAMLSEHPVDAGPQPLVFNFSLTGMGPVMELICFRRLLDQGIRPKRLFLEVLPLYLHQEEGYAEEYWTNIHTLGIGDVSTMARFCQAPWNMHFRFWRSRLIPWYSNRYGCLNRYAPRWLPWDYRTDDIRNTDLFGWKPWYQLTVTEKEYDKALGTARWQFARALNGFRVTDQTDRALREVLELCKLHNIPVSLYMMPEGKPFQELYTPDICRQVDEYLAALREDYGVTVINARSWVEDKGFFDGHHLLPAGATTFTERFQSTILQPLLEGRPFELNVPLSKQGT